MMVLLRIFEDIQWILMRWYLMDRYVFASLTVSKMVSVIVSVFVWLGLSQVFW